MSGFKGMSMKQSQIILISLSSLLLASCLSNAASPFKPALTIQEIMTAVIDPNIDFVWNSVSTVATAQGIEEKRPQTEEDWQAIKQHAQVVLEAANLLVIEGRPVANAGANTSSGGAELSAKEIETLISRNQEEFIARSHGLHRAMQEVIAAIDRRDVDALEKAGGSVEQACELCHTQFWYPNDQRPK